MYYLETQRPSPSGEMELSNWKPEQCSSLCIFCVHLCARPYKNGCLTGQASRLPLGCAVVTPLSQDVDSGVALCQCLGDDAAIWVLLPLFAYLIFHE